MVDAEVEVTSDVIGDISPQIFGGLLEHLGRCVYDGVWDLSTQRPRSDVLGAMRALAPTALRWPGGCFSAWYRWRDGVGPRDERPTRDRQFWTDNSAHWARAAGRDEVEFTTALGPPETHSFGTDEFLRYSGALGAEPLLVVNLGGGAPRGDGSPEEAASWVRYCNRDRRAPRPVEWWGIGNETWGGHEPGHCTPAEYGARVREFATAMRADDRSIKTIAPGVLVGPGTVAEWNDVVLRNAHEAIDALSLHWYFPGPLGRSRTHDEAELRQIMTAGDTLGELLDATIAGIDQVVGSERALPIVIGEWGFMADVDEHLGTSHWFCDGPFFAGCLHRFIERSDRVAQAYYAQLVNVLGPIQTEGQRHFVTTAFLVLVMYRRLLRRRAVRTVVLGDELAVPPMPALDRRLFGPRAAAMGRRAPVVDACATVDDRGTAVAVANRGLDRPVRICLAGLPARACGALVATAAADPFARNSLGRPHAVGWYVVEAQVDPQGRCTIELAPGSVGVASFA
ncbi:MAG: alpha-L-arabinofuranosidase C-terminal domain-containing protein [Acidimicrobiales bacterium]